MCRSTRSDIPHSRRLCGNPDGGAHPDIQAPEAPQASLSRRGASISSATEALGDALSIALLFVLVWVVLDFPRVVRFLAEVLL